ncbi:hypothetical protein BDV96DRAFT_577910 [Lophiotrema nucula]|uniref:Uncharacterized protein n=1 Tax=Lophiotrema nucula TaxID=690887 RepID=A0A6A5Z289_9PLEO|nr:hypothetical protein BDV96DRAFT_577910 [Lophiotrema nucula]
MHRHMQTHGCLLRLFRVYEKKPRYLRPIPIGTLTRRYDTFPVVVGRAKNTFSPSRSSAGFPRKGSKHNPLCPSYSRGISQNAFQDVGSILVANLMAGETQIYKVVVENLSVVWSGSGVGELGQEEPESPKSRTSMICHRADGNARISRLIIPEMPPVNFVSDLCRQIEEPCRRAVHRWDIIRRFSHTHGVWVIQGIEECFCGGGSLGQCC